MTPDFEGLEAMEGSQGTSESDWEGTIWEIDSDLDGQIMELFVKGPFPQWVNQGDSVYRITVTSPDPTWQEKSIRKVSPANGYILRIFVKEGETVMEKMPLYELLVHSVGT